MENTNMPVISAKDLNLWYGDFKALKNISLDVGEREITALIGPSGCGKSTFLKTLNRMNDLVPNVRIEGDVRLRGEDIFSKELQLTDLRRRVGMVFQKANPFPMSIYDNITYGPKLHGVRNKAELDELVESSLRGAALWDEVKDRLKKSALGLSGGQQQRIMAIAEEGLRGSYGANIGSVLLDMEGNDVRVRAKAYAAAGSDARMNGCEQPVVINSGSGNQGISSACASPGLWLSSPKSC